MTSATARVIKAAHCAAIRTPASRTNSTTIGMRATSAESARLFATGWYTCSYTGPYLPEASVHTWPPRDRGRRPFPTARRRLTRQHGILRYPVQVFRACRVPNTLRPFFITPGDERYPQVVDVGAGRAGDEQRPPGLERYIGVVVRQRPFRVHPSAPDLARRLAGYQPARRVGRAVVAVGVGRERRPALDAVELHGEGEGELLVGAARTLPPDRHGGLAAAHHGAGWGEGAAALQGLPDHRRVHRGYPASVPGYGGGEQEGLVPELAGLLHRRLGRVTPAPADHVGDPFEDGVARLRGLLGYLQVLGHAPRRLYPVALQHPARLLQGRRVRGGEAAGYRRGVVAHDVGEQEREGWRGRGEAHQTTALQDRDVLADGVDLAYVGPASQESPRELFQVGELYGRGRVRQERRGAAGDEGEEQVPLAERSREFLGSSCGLHALFVRLGVGGEYGLELLRMGLVAVLGDDKPAGDALPQHPL